MLEEKRLEKHELVSWVTVGLQLSYSWVTVELQLLTRENYGWVQLGVTSADFGISTLRTSPRMEVPLLQTI